MKENSDNVVEAPRSQQTIPNETERSYQPPTIIFLGALAKGMGTCEDGSGDNGPCHSGSFAIFNCTTGDNAGGTCTSGTNPGT